MVVAKNIVMKYRNKQILNNIDFCLDDGKITVLIGKNGAGKTTTINCVTNFLKHSGDIYIDGFKNCSIDAKKKLGYIPDTPTLYEYLTVYEHIEFIAKAYKLTNWNKKSAALLQRFGLLEEKNKICKELSKGMKQKLSVCCALLHSPQTIIFDEPFVGLDPISIKELKTIIRELKNDGKCIMISTHILESVEDIWDKVYVIDKGHIVKSIERDDSNEKTLTEIFFS